MSPPNRIRDLRLAHQPHPLSKSALAELAGVAWKTVHRAELGVAISDVNEERIARALGVPREELFAEVAA